MGGIRPGGGKGSKLYKDWRTQRVNCYPRATRGERVVQQKVLNNRSFHSVNFSSKSRSSSSRKDLARISASTAVYHVSS